MPPKMLKNGIEEIVRERKRRDKTEQWSETTDQTKQWGRDEG
jgi:hypothetical protein